MALYLIDGNDTQWSDEDGEFCIVDGESIKRPAEDGSDYFTEGTCIFESARLFATEAGYVARATRNPPRKLTQYQAARLIAGC